MALQLRDNLHWCDCDGRAVFLDVQADRYFCLPQTANDAFRRLAAGATQPEDIERLHALAASGMLIEAGAGVAVPPPPRIDPPTGDFVEDPKPRAGLLSIARALASELRGASLLRTKRFHAVIAAAQSRGQRRESTVEPGRLVQEIVSASAALSVVTRSHDRCLVRALAVHSVCRRSGIRTKLVFGVVAHPFTAHCWVQLGSAVLVGGYEQARLYTPILVIE
ncbi:MAG: lasso peptide biosynthesis B2 protein [Sphingomicrobium sp.]